MNDKHKTPTVFSSSFSVPRSSFLLPPLPQVVLTLNSHVHRSAFVLSSAPKNADGGVRARAMRRASNEHKEVDEGCDDVEATAVRWRASCKSWATAGRCS